MTCCNSGDFFIDPVVSFPQFSHTVCCSVGFKIFHFDATFNINQGRLLRGLMGLGPFTTRVSTLARDCGNVFNVQDFEQNETPFKQRSFEDSIDTFLLRWGSPAKQSGRNEGILFKLWRKEIPKIPNIFIILFHLP